MLVIANYNSSIRYSQQMRTLINHCIYCIFLFLSLSTGAQSGTFYAQISGSFSGLDSGTVQILSEDADDTLCQSVILAGHFKIQHQFATAKQYLWRITPGNWHFKAFVEPGNSTLHIDTTGAKRNGKAVNDPNAWALIWQVEQSGTPMATDYSRYLQQTRQQWFREQLLKAMAQQDIAVNKKNYTRLIDSLQKEAQQTQLLWIEQFMTTKPDVPSASFIILQYIMQAIQPDWTVCNRWFHQLKVDETPTYYYQQLKEKLLAQHNQSAGTMMPDVRLRQANHQPFSFSSLQGQYVLLDFWASWCGPCRKEIPAWKKIYEKYRPQGLEIVGISGDRYDKDWRKALAKEKMPWIQLIDSFPSKNQSAMLSDYFGIRLIPHYILLDKTGKVLLSTDDPALIRQNITQLIEKKD